MKIDGIEFKKERLILIIQLMIKELKTTYTQTGICRTFYTLMSNKDITYDEIYIVKMFININKPTKRNKYKEFTKNPYWTNFVDSYSYWWTEIHIAPETKQIRIDYLTALINNIK